MPFLKRRSRRRGSFQPICDEHRIPAYYLGVHQAKGKVGLSVIREPVAALFLKFREVTGKRVLLEVKDEGLWVKHTGEGAGERLARRHTIDIGANPESKRLNNAYVIPVDDISFGAVDTNHRKIFAIIVRQNEPNADHRWECHPFLCNTHSEAKHLTLNLVACFQKLSQAKGDEVGSSSNPNTMNVFTESVYPRYQSSNGNVTTLKITFNVEQVDTNWIEPSLVYNRNKDISQILSEKGLLNGKTNRAEDGNGGKSGTPLSGSSDKENDGSDSDILEELSPASTKSRTSVVAVNTGLIELTAVQEEVSEEDLAPTPPTTQSAAQPPAQVADGIAQAQSPIPVRTKPKPKKKMVRFTAEINYID